MSHLGGRLEATMDMVATWDISNDVDAMAHYRDLGGMRAIHNNIVVESDTIMQEWRGGSVERTYQIMTGDVSLRGTFEITPTMMEWAGADSVEQMIKESFACGRDNLGHPAIEIDGTICETVYLALKNVRIKPVNSTIVLVQVDLAFE